MLRIFNTLLGNDIRYLYRYLCFVVLYGVLCAVMMVILAGILQQLLLGQTQHLPTYLAIFILIIVVSWLWRYQVEQAGIRVGVAIIQEHGNAWEIMLPVCRLAGLTRIIKAYFNIP